MNEPVDESSAVLAALAEPVRRQLLNILAARNEATATTVAEGLPITRQAVVKHFAVLTNAGLITSRKQGREVLYSVRPEQVDATARWMADLAAGWDNRLRWIKRLAEAQDVNRPASEPQSKGT
jgi:DNA-binding transcriptional ArsR family regulator